MNDLLSAPFLGLLLLAAFNAGALLIHQDRELFGYVYPVSIGLSVVLLVAHLILRRKRQRDLD